MKKKFLFLASLVCALLAACTSGGQFSGELIVIDVNRDYPEKEIPLEEVADIEYLQFELNDDFLFAGVPRIITSDRIIFSQLGGDILIFSRDGKPLSKFNHIGNGPGEYVYISRLMYDEATDEIFVLSNNRMLVYASSGDFKRVIPFEDRYHFNEMVNYDSESFLFYDEAKRFSFISKEDGSVMDSIGIPAGKDLVLYVMIDAGNILIAPTHHFVRHKDGFLLTDYTIDTVYFLSWEKKLSPVLVRKPDIQSMNPIVYLNSFVEAGNYEFVSAITIKLENRRLPSTYLMRDKKTGAVYRQKITFSDYQGETVNLSPETMANTQDSKLGLIVFNLEELKEANSENKLNGKLKQLVENSDEDGNDIYMLLHFK